MDSIRERVISDVLRAQERLCVPPLREESFAHQSTADLQHDLLRRLWVEAAARTFAAIEALDRVQGNLPPDGGKLPETLYQKKIKPEQHPADRDWITVAIVVAGLLILAGLMVGLVAWGAAR